MAKKKKTSKQSWSDKQLKQMGYRDYRVKAAAKGKEPMTREEYQRRVSADRSVEQQKRNKTGIPGKKKKK